MKKKRKECAKGRGNGALCEATEETICGQYCGYRLVQKILYGFEIFFAEPEGELCALLENGIYKL